ncbi:MAG: hypoxanthine phosphoribosyltransferase [Phycisphaerae bacterium]
MCPSQPNRGEQSIRNDIERVLFTEEQIARRVETLAGQIAEQYAGRELTILAVLTGSLIFLADLIRKLPLPMRLDLVSVSSYPGQATRSEGPKVTVPPAGTLRGRNVLIVDDILDSGLTLQYLLDMVAEYQPESVSSCVLLRKERPDVENRTEAEFVGFDLPDEFVVGYGLDYDHLYRNLPDICVLKKHLYQDSQ